MSHMQSKTWVRALMASTSLLALGVPMASEGWQLRGNGHLDMWKPAYDMETIDPSHYGQNVASFPNARKL